MTATSVFVATEQEARARGRELGVAVAPRIQAVWQTYQQIFEAHGLGPDLVRDVADAALTEVVAWSPSLADELVGVAAGAGLETWQVAAINARSEVLARYRAMIPGECSTAVFLPALETPRTIQTWDWHEGLRGLTLLWQLQPRPGWTVKTFTECGLLGKIGVNSAGLGLHFNLLQHEADGVGAGVPVHLLARRILDEAADLDEAEAIIRSAEVTASVALTVVTHSEGGSAAATFEVSPVGVRRLEASGDGFLFHTNHFLDPELAQQERLGPGEPGTYSRLQRLVERAALLQSPDLGERAAAMVSHEDDGAALCCHPGPPGDITARWQTLVTIGIDVARGRLAIRDGNPCRTSTGAWVEV